MSSPEVAVQSLEDCIERCENRLSLLNNKISEVQRSSDAVDSCSTEVKLLLEKHFKKLLNNVTQTIESRKEELLTVIAETCKSDHDLLKDLKEHLENDARLAKELLEEGSKAGNDGEDEERKNEAAQRIEDELKKYCRISGSGDAQCVALSMSAFLDETQLNTSLDSLKQCLDVTMTGSLQFVDSSELPGAILLKWDEPLSDAESVTTDNSVLNEFILQSTSGVPVCSNGEEGNGETSNVFSTIYTGEDMQFLVTDIVPNNVYTFRVCHRQMGGYHDSGAHGPWSLPKKASTSLKAHEWRESDCLHGGSDLPLFQLSNRSRTATKIFPESSQILRSKSASYRIGQTITFSIDEAGDRSNKDGIGFITTDYDKQTDHKQLPLSPHAAVITTKGGIYVNGVNMVTKLPVLKRGTVLTFNTAVVGPGKLRVTCSDNDREVTFDWVTTNDDKCLYFACGFEHTGWQVTVS